MYIGILFLIAKIDTQYIILFTIKRFYFCDKKKWLQIDYNSLKWDEVDLFW